MFRSLNEKRRRNTTSSLLKAKFRDGEFGTELEQIFARTLIDAIQQLKRDVASADVLMSVRRTIDQAMATLSEVLGAADVGAIADLMTQEIIKAGIAEAAIFPKTSAVKFSFDRADPRAIAWAQLRAGQLITQVTDEVKLTVSDVTTRLLNGEINLREAKAEIQRNIGLHDRWQKAVDNSFDKTYEQLIEAGVDPIDAEEMAFQAADKYSNQLLKARASNIARTELATAQNQGRYIGWQQAAEQGWFDPNVTVKEWRTAPEYVSSKTLVCPICEPMDGVQAPVWAEFDEVGVIMPPAHPNCRCRAVLIVPPIEDVIADVLAARELYGY